MVLSEVFGETGLATIFFSGEWWVVGIYLLLVFITFLLAYKVNAQGIMILTVIGLLTVGGYQLFIIDEQIVQTILLFIFIGVGFIAYLFFSR